MGEVWRAQDTKLGRDVALKVLPESFAQDPERLERFEREARVLASLSHPNIAGIHGLEDVEGKRFLVMEVAEGETLAERIARGPLPVEEAVRIAKQIAEALEVAHEKGIVHRDLKPGNVMVTPEGQVKVLDFGLAKAMGIHPLSGSSGEAFTQSPTLAPGMTQAGMLLGTAGYMSPEQARGKSVDRRSDIWSFGCVLFEMLGGRRAFDGETVTDVLGAIVHKEPELSKLPADVPGRIRGLIGRCLQKDASRRLQSIGDARIALVEWLEHPEEENAAVAPAPAGWRRWLPWTVAAVLGVAALLQALGIPSRGGSRSEPVRRSLVQVDSPPLDTSIGSNVALSPDGRNLVYVTGSTASKALHLRPLDRYDSTVVASGDYPDQPYHPFFSPDGEWLGYVTAREMKKVPVAGGAPVTLCAVNLSRGASWGPDGTIVFAPSQNSGLSLVSAAGGEPHALTTLDADKGEVSHRWPQWLPGGKAVLFTVGTNKDKDWNDATIEVVEVASGKRTVIHRGGSPARYVATGHVIFFNRGTLFALPFDVDKLEPRGSQFPVVERVAGRPGHGGADFAVSRDGLLAYGEGGQGANPFRMVWVDRDGRSQPLWEEPGLFGTPRLSPDGKKLAATVLRDGNFDVWVFDLERTVATRLTFADGYEGDEVWSPDGRFLAFASDRDGAIKIYRKRADGSGDAELLSECMDGRQCFPNAWSPDGRTLAVSTDQSDIWMIPLEGGGEAEPYVATPALEGDAVFSPDGRWVAYTSTESGDPEVYVQSYPIGAGKWQVSDGMGLRPLWTRGGKEIVFRTDKGMSAVAVDSSGGTFRPEKARPLFTGSFLGDLQGIALGSSVFSDYDAAADGNRFVMFVGAGGKEAAWINLVGGWFGDLRRLSATGGGQ